MIDPRRIKLLVPIGHNGVVVPVEVVATVKIMSALVLETPVPDHILDLVANAMSQTLIQKFSFDEVD